MPRSVPAGRGFTLAEFDVFCPKATAGIGGLPETILDRAIVIQMERRSRHDPVEKLRERRARELGEPLRKALAYHVSRIEDLTLADDALPVELDDRAQDGWEPLIAIADAAGDAWATRARRAAVAIFISRSVIDDNLGLRLLHDCHTVFDELTDAFVSTVRLRAALIALDQSPWSDVRGKEITPHYMGKLLRAFGIESDRERVEADGNPVHGYRRSDFRDTWERYLGVPPAGGTSSTSGTTTGAEPRPTGVPVPVVPDVPDAPGLRPAAPSTIGGAPLIEPARAGDEPTLWTA